jgi:hypothetical protein
VTTPRTGCAARLLYRDRHLCADRWYSVTRPDGETYDLCSGACLVSFAVYGALPADPELRADTEAAPTGTPTEEGTAA